MGFTATTKRWQVSQIVIGIVLLALGFSGGSTTPLHAQTLRQIANTVSVTFEGADGALYGPNTSNTVITTIGEN